MSALDANLTHMTNKAHESIEQMLSETRDDLKNADQKAAVLLAALGVGFGAVIAGQIAGKFDSSTLQLPGQIIWWVGVAAALAAVALAALAVWPRYNLNDSPEFGITYWGHIAAFQKLDGLEEALEEQDTTSARRTNHQLWRLSRSVLWKYRFVRASLVAAALGGATLGVATIFFR